MKKLIILAVTCFVPPLPQPPELPPTSLRVKGSTSKDPIEKALAELALPCPDRIHVNDIIGQGIEGERFGYRPFDMYDDCADAMDLLVKSRAAVEDRLIQRASKGKALPERYRAAWVLVQRSNQKIIPILYKMAASSSAEERFLVWDVYTKGINSKKLPVPESVKAALACCRKEKNRYVQAQIMAFLGVCKAKEAVPLLLEALKDDPQYSAVEALGWIGDPKAVPAIIEVASKEKTNAHIYHCALGQIGSEEAVDYLIRQLDDDCFAIDALFQTKSRKALPVLEKHLEKLRKQGKPDELALAFTQIAVLRLKYQDPRVLLIGLAEDRSQSQDMRTHALEALEDYDKTPYSDRLLRLYRADTEDWMRMFYIRLLCIGSARTGTLPSER